ncbi:hypothetical protein SNE40_018213 [Patella caerulea]|uniref:Reverse transcriptase domain-containing protein n=1 Tax=Patella caerulea TaxID=87958 RepID=A0AAN8JBE0_PATCE
MCYGIVTYLLLVIKTLLLVGCIEQNPGPFNALSTCNISIVHNNVCSLLPKLDIIEAEFSDHDIICITESHLDNTIKDSEILLPGYRSPIRLDRNRHGGGVVVYIKNNLHFQIRHDLINPNIELIFIDLFTDYTKFLLGVLYRPPNTRVAFWDILYDTLSNALDSDSFFILTGDFNINILSNSSNCAKFEKLLQRLNLENLIKEPTNFTTLPGSCIDLFITNRKSLISETHVNAPICSTHSPIILSLNIKTYKQLTYKRTVRNYKLADYEGLNNELMTVDWSQNVFKNDDINKIYESFLDVLNKTLIQYIPTKVVTIRPNDKPFMNNAIRIKIRNRNRAHKRAKKTNSPNHWLLFRKVRNEVITLIREAKSNFKDKLEQQINIKNLPPNKWWKIAKTITNFDHKNVTTSPLLFENCVYTHPLDKANILNTYFASISKLNNVPDLPYFAARSNNELPNFIVSEHEVKDQLLILNCSKPSGPDNISPAVLKNITPSITSPLTKFFNLSLELQLLPDIWKTSHIIAAYKGKGDPHSPDNYRPISLTCSLCKILEKILFKNLYNFIKENNLLYKYQSGFQPNDSTVNQLLEIYDVIISNLDKGKQIRFIFCDVSKAFDKVWHIGLLAKLKQYGINKTLCKWIEHYLSNRKQCVVLEGFKSSYLHTDSGVPQGSVLGPFLFLIYLNDISDNITNNIRLFADDTSLFTIIHNDPLSSANSIT